MFDEKELNNIFATIIVIAIVFAFDDKRQVFQLGFWALNFLKILLFSMIVVFSYELAQKFTARLYKARTFHEINYNIRLFKKSKSFPVTIFIAFLSTIFSNGRFYFASIKKTEVILDKKLIGKPYQFLREFDVAKIISSGPLFTIFLAALVSSIKLPGLDSLELMLIAYSIYNILPIPPLDGSKIFFNSLPLFILSFIFIILTSLLLFFIPSLPTIVISVIVSLIFFFMILKRLN
nr:hypothetical protein [Candidatus Woesearchaeota archaeon]